MLDRSHFDDKTLETMDDIARLLHIKMSVSEMNRTFKNAQELDAAGAKPLAKLVMKATCAAAEDLLKQAFARKHDGLSKIQRRHLPGLVAAARAAARLAEQEYGAFPEIAGKGVFDLRVLRPLQELTQRWHSMARH